MVDHEPPFLIDTDDSDGFTIATQEDADVEFARERLLDGWDQEMIARARVMVVGAGALGNEALKNLALLGFRNLFVLDMDTISRSNLSRSVLFGRSDQGRDKAAAAARRTRQLCLAPHPRVRHFSGDLTTDLGSGVYRRMDVVLGCLDNVAARIATDANCWLFGVPWVEGGMAGYQGNVTVFIPVEGPCYLCTLSESDRSNERQRYSCDQRKQRYAMANQIAAVQTVSSVIAATQVQEALKVLQGQREPRTIFYDGRTNQMEQSAMGSLASHPLHHPTLINRSIHEIRRLSYAMPVSEALRVLEEELKKPITSIRLDHQFISDAICAHCGYVEAVLRPLARIWADEYQRCPQCGSATPGAEQGGMGRVEDLAIRLVPHREVGPASPAAFMPLALGQLGIPPLHVLQVRTAEGTTYVELTGDASQVLGRWGAGANHAEPTSRVR